MVSYFAVKFVLRPYCNFILLFYNFFKVCTIHCIIIHTLMYADMLYELVFREVLNPLNLLKNLQICKIVTTLLL